MSQHEIFVQTGKEEKKTETFEMLQEVCGEEVM
jgi:hypothetical protein